MEKKSVLRELKLELPNIERRIKADLGGNNKIQKTTDKQPIQNVSETIIQDKDNNPPNKKMKL